MTQASTFAPRPSRPDRPRPPAAASAAALCCLALAAGAPPAEAGGASRFGGATEWTQLLNNAELARMVSIESNLLSTETDSLATQLSQYQTQLNAYAIMQRNVAALPSHIVGDAMNPVVQLRRISRQAGAVAHSGAALDEFLRSDLITDPRFERRGLDRARIGESYAAWQGRWDAATRTSLGQAGLTLADVETEAALIERIQSRMGTEEGQMQVLQAGNEYAAALVRILNDLRRITAVQGEENSIAMGRMLSDQDRLAAEEAEEARRIQEALEEVRRDTGGRTLNELWRIDQ